MKSGELDVRLGHGFGVQINNWFQQDRFQMSFAFSYILAPQSHGGRRRFPAYFIKDRFNIWARPHETNLMKFRTDRIEEQIFEWFLDFRADCLAKSTKVTKDEAKAKCEAYFERDELGAMFNAVWKLLSVHDMKALGRPKGKA